MTPPFDDLATALEILRSARVIAIVGLSPDPSRPSHGVARYLQRAGYRIVPVNPTVDAVLGETAYPGVSAIPFPIDTVDVFRRSERTDAAIDDAIAAGAGAVWLQLGIVNPAGIARARAAGLLAVHDRCMAIDHPRLATS